MRQSCSARALVSSVRAQPMPSIGSSPLPAATVARVIADWRAPAGAVPRCRECRTATGRTTASPRDLPRCARHRPAVVQPRGQTANLTRLATKSTGATAPSSSTHRQTARGFEDLPSDSGRIRLTIRQQDQRRAGARSRIARIAEAGQCVAELSDPKNENRRHRATCAESACSTEWSSSRTVRASPSLRSGHRGSEKISFASRSATGNLAAPRSSGL